jgi:NADH dehydrogenase (ubiquinone) Fe-S protein 6
MVGHQPRITDLTSQGALKLSTMLANARSRAIYQLTRRAQVSTRRAYAFSANDKREVNDSKPSKEVPNVSKTNELPIETPHQDAPLQEYADDAEKLRVTQAPNRTGIWSRSQNPRAKAMTGPRFEQTIMELQVRGSLTLLLLSLPWLP